MVVIQTSEGLHKHAGEHAGLSTQALLEAKHELLALQQVCTTQQTGCIVKYALPFL